MPAVMSMRDRYMAAWMNRNTRQPSVNIFLCSNTALPMLLSMCC